MTTKPRMALTQPTTAACERFVDWLIAMDDPDPVSVGGVRRRSITLNQIIQRAKEARDRDRD